jgi:hypothetical protein
MTFVTHGYAGAVAYIGICRLAGVDGGWVAPTAGGILGSAPDTLDWILARGREWPKWLGFIERSRFNRIGLIDRWSLYVWWHHSTAALLISLILIAPGIHILVDRLIHSPVIPRKEEEKLWPEEMVTVIDYSILGLRIQFDAGRRNVLWATGELMLISLTTNLLQAIQ